MPGLSKLLRRSITVLTIALLVLAACAWLALHGSLPQYSGSMHSDGIDADISLERDALGTLTVRGDTRRDVAWGLGFAHAQERFFGMDLLRRRAAGELAELFGSAALPLDRGARVHRMRSRMRAAFEALPQADRDAIRAYRDGVNAGIAALGVRPFEYLLSRNKPAPWQDEDTLLVIAAMAFTLNDADNQRELGLARLHAALPQSAWDFLAASGGGFDAPIAGAPLTWPELPPASDLDMRARAAPARMDGTSGGAPAKGSNAFAVAGALAGGPALVANDMHLDLGVPNLWFRTRLVYPDPRMPDGHVDVTGASLPGAPAIVVGSNGRIAWGFTNSYADVADWVRVTVDPNDPGRYRTADGWQSFEHHDETIRVHGGNDEHLAIKETIWGPVLAQDTDGTPLALAWTAHRPGAINIDLVRLESARNVDEGVTIAQASGIPPQNFLVGDRNGDIAWTIAGRLPRRTGDFDPRLPADWSRADAGWSGWLSPAETPLVSNPPWQRLWSANQRTVEGPALERLGDGGYDLGARAWQIREGLRARSAFTPADMLAIQLDDRALHLDAWRELMMLELNRVPETDLRRRMKDIVQAWDGRASVDSVSYRLVRAWHDDMIDRVLDGFAAVVRSKTPEFRMPKLPQAEHAAWALLRARPAHLLPPGYADWDALLAASLDHVGEELDAQAGGIAQRTWGERNTARIAHPMSRALPAFLARRLDMPREPLPGDRDMPRVQAPDFGASERFAVSPGDEANGYFMMPGGQSGHPLSPYYGAGHADWVRGTPTPFLPGPPEAVLVIQPARQPGGAD